MCTTAYLPFSHVINCLWWSLKGIKDSWISVPTLNLSCRYVALICWSPVIFREGNNGATIDSTAVEWYWPTIWFWASQKHTHLLSLPRKPQPFCWPPWICCKNLAHSRFFQSEPVRTFFFSEDRKQVSIRWFAKSRFCWLQQVTMVSGCRNRA